MSRRDSIPTEIYVLEQRHDVAVECGGKQVTRTYELYSLQGSAQFYMGFRFSNKTRAIGCAKNIASVCPGVKYGGVEID